MTHMPGAREIPDPEAEIRRLADARQQPDPDHWTVETVQRVKVTHTATGKSAEAPTRGEALGKLLVELLNSGDISINTARKAYGLKPFDFAEADQPRGSQRWAP